MHSVATCSVIRQRRRALLALRSCPRDGRWRGGRRRRRSCARGWRQHGARSTRWSCGFCTHPRRWIRARRCDYRAKRRRKDAVDNVLLECIWLSQSVATCRECGLRQVARAAAVVRRAPPLAAGVATHAGRDARDARRTRPGASLGVRGLVDAPPVTVRYYQLCGSKGARSRHLVNRRTLTQ